MIRLASGVILLLLAAAIVWLASDTVFLVAAEILLIGGLVEYLRLARSSGLQVPAIAAAAAAVAACAAFSNLIGSPRATPPLDVVLLSALVAIGSLAIGQWRSGPHAVGSASAALFPTLYLGCPLGAMVAIREAHGPGPLSLLMLAVIVSDTAQYYSGRAFGRRPLAAAISPKKTIEGAIGGFAAGALFIVIVGRWWLPEVPVGLRALLGVTLVAVGIAGDLFESMIKRSAQVKDSSSLIPGHGGVLDRIDALLFAAPVFYVVLKYT
jgi:phosphatidate cytidylyltransferase